MRQEQSNSTPRQPPKVPRNPSTPQPAGETQSSGAAGETQSSGAAGETHSSGAGSQSRQQDEAHSSGADNENRLENEEESNNNQDSEGVDEVSRPLDKNCVTNRVPTSTGKPGKSQKQVPCMEKSWNLKKTEKSWKNHGIM